MVSRLLPILPCLLLAAACTGPVTKLQNPAGHRVFVDGMHVDATELAFRYYGTSRWDAEPADAATGPDWSRQPASGPIPLPPPISPWLFPLDFPIELARRIGWGREDAIALVELPPTPAALLVLPEVQPPGLGELVNRANQARIAR